MDGLIRQSREIRLRAALARADAARLRKQAVDLVGRAEEARNHRTLLGERIANFEPGAKRLPRIQRFVVTVGTIQVGGRLLTRGDVVTDELLRLDFKALVEQRLLHRRDYRLSELDPPGDPKQDGRWMG